MSRNKPYLALFLLLALMACSAPAWAESLISEEMIQNNTVNYSETAVMEKSIFERRYSEQAAEYYPHTYVLCFEGDDARFGEYLVKRKQEVKAGDVLATFELDVDEVALASKKQALRRTQENYETQKLKKQEAIQEQLEALEDVRDRFDWEILKLTIERAQISLEQYCCEQERQIARLQKELAELEEKYSQTALIAPFDGVVINLEYKQDGEHLSKNEALVTIYRTDGMLLRIKNANGHFRYGMEVQVAVGPAKSRTILTGRIIAADQMLPQSQRAGYAYIELDPSSGEMPDRGVTPNASAAGYYVENVFVLPRRAVELDSGKYYVNKLEDDVVHKRYVNIAVQGTGEVWVLQGIEEGETIIID